MISRRAFTLGLAAPFVALGAPAWAQRMLDRETLMAREIRLRSPERVGQIVVHPRSFFLYHVVEPQLAVRYPVGVGEAGHGFSGRAVIQRKAEWPSWTPTQNMIRREPENYLQYAGGVPGGPGNPLGSRALYLYRNGRDTLYRIHGTNDANSIGGQVSAGCIRMFNEHVEYLYERVPTGTRVTVV